MDLTKIQEQSRAEQSRAEQSRAEQSRAEQSRAERFQNIISPILTKKLGKWLAALFTSLLLLFGSGSSQAFAGSHGSLGYYENSSVEVSLSTDLKTLKITVGAGKSTPIPIQQTISFWSDVTIKDTGGNVICTLWPSISGNNSSGSTLVTSISASASVNVDVSNYADGTYYVYATTHYGSGFSDWYTDTDTAYFVINRAAATLAAANAANSAAQNAQAAAQAAQQAADNVNTIVNNTLTVSAGVVQDSSGTVLTAARAAQAAAQNAVTGIQDTQNKLDNLQTTITNNFSNLQNYLPPTLLKVSGYQGATATSASTFRVALDYSNATDYRIAVDGNWGPWSSLSSYESTGYVTATGLNTPGVHQITVELRNGQNGPTVQRSMSVFKL